MRACLIFILSITGYLPFSGATLAQEARQTPISLCQAIARHGPGIIPASFTPITSDALGRYDVKITYVAHSTFRIEDATGLKIATDYSGNAGPGIIPDVVTMNNAHITHWTPAPDPGITHVLPGWGQEGEPAQYNIQIGETLIRNVTTDIQSNWVGHKENGNSIFIFEMGGLCIGHLGHLHHLLSDEHYAAIGRLDVLMVPIDGGYTLNLADMVTVVKRLNASVILPMHWFGEFSLQRFLTEMKEGFPIDAVAGSDVTLSLNTLPDTATVMVLRPSSEQYFNGFGDP